MGKKRKKLTHPITFDQEILDYLGFDEEKALRAGEQLRDLGYMTKKHIDVESVLRWDGNAPERVVQVLGEEINYFGYDYDDDYDEDYEYLNDEELSDDPDDYYLPVITTLIMQAKGISPGTPVRIPAADSVVMSIMQDMLPGATSAIVTITPRYQPERTSSAAVTYLPDTDEIEYEYGLVMVMMESASTVPIGGWVLRVFHPTEKYEHTNPKGELMMIPRKVVGGGQVIRDEVLGISSGEMMDSHCKDHRTGDILPPEYGVDYAHLEDKVWTRTFEL